MRRCEGALSGGVNLALLAETPAMFQKAGMLSPEGRCKTLDAAADGYVRAEACGATTLAAWDTRMQAQSRCSAGVSNLM